MCVPVCVSVPGEGISLSRSFVTLRKLGTSQQVLPWPGREGMSRDTLLRGTPREPGHIKQCRRGGITSHLRSSGRDDPGDDEWAGALGVLLP